MRGVNNILLIITAIAIVFLESWITIFRRLLGAQIELLPTLMVFAGLRKGLILIGLLALVGGLALDSLSANPLGVSVLPLFLVGFLIHRYRAYILKEERYAQLLLGVAACGVTPIMTLLVLLSLGQQPLIGWGSLLQWLIMVVAGGMATPFICGLFERVQRSEKEPVAAEPSFREDREIVRGR